MLLLLSTGKYQTNSVQLPLQLLRKRNKMKKKETGKVGRKEIIPNVSAVVQQSGVANLDSSELPLLVSNTLDPPLAPFFV